MKKIVRISLCLAAVASASIAGQALAQSPALPAWKIADICAKEGTPGQCAAFEGVALRSVSSSWQFLLDDIKTACLSQLSNPHARSWRELASCVDNANSRALDRVAVKTARTPAEAEPPPSVVLPALPADLMPREPATSPTPQNAEAPQQQPTAAPSKQ